jgi:protein required for attachment to host cells
MTGRTTWILVCDASRARLFSDTSPNRSYALVQSFEHPECRQHVTELVTDAQGRKPVGGSRGAGVRGRPGGFFGRPGTEQATLPKDVEAIKFARDLSTALERGLDDHAYDALVITAPPRFLGQLLETLPEQVRRHLVRTIDKDLSLLPLRDVEKRVRAQQAA